MYKCEDCGNTARFIVDFMERRFGTVEAEWHPDDEWEVDDLGEGIEEEGEVSLGPAPRACAVCQSPRIEKIPKEVGDDAEEPL